MLRRDTFVIEIFQSVPDKIAGGAFIPFKRCQFERRSLTRPERIVNALQRFPRHSSFHKIALRQFLEKLHLLLLPLRIAI
jgi:hypothetical protein